MLARPGAPFDSPDWQFEIKWDGTRTVAYVEGATLRLMNRRQLDIAHRFPELRCLAMLPSGTVLDGEIVVLDAAGKPEFAALQSRDHTSSTSNIARLARTARATYVVFDQLYDRFRSLMDRPLTERRGRLARTLRRCADPQVVMSDAVVGEGVRCFEAAVSEGLEGIVAKRLDGRYLPGRRSDCWLKVKRHERVHCAIVGYEPRGRWDVRSLVLAAEVGGALAYAGRVGSGMDEATRARLAGLLRLRPRGLPVVPCRGARAVWVEPGLYCEVRCMERTKSGALRAPVFMRLLRRKRERATVEVMIICA